MSVSDKIGTVSKNSTYVTNKDYPRSTSTGGLAMYTVEVLPDVCHLRLDFHKFTIAPTDTTDPNIGDCRTDKFTTTCSQGTQMPLICGENSKNHGKIIVLLLARYMSRESIRHEGDGKIIPASEFFVPSLNSETYISTEKRQIFISCIEIL